VFPACDDVHPTKMSWGRTGFDGSPLRLEGMPGATPPVNGVEHTTANTQFALAA
jgi:hypothetical protein